MKKKIDLIPKREVIIDKQEESVYLDSEDQDEQDSIMNFNYHIKK